MWWSNNEQRRQQKEIIKNIIKRTKLNEKTTQPLPASANTPPSLCHSLPTTTTTYSDHLDRTRSASVESQFSNEFNFNQIPAEYYSSSMIPPPDFTASHPPFPLYSPYEVDIKTERQTFINDIPTQRDSSISTFSTYQLPPPPHSDGMATFPAESWVQEDYYESRRESLNEEPIDFHFFDFPHGPITPSHQAIIDVEDCDRHLLDHFIQNVLRLIFPILDVNQHGSARDDVIMPALEKNKTYLHCCLSIAALHLKATERIQGEQIDNDIMRHRYATISELCEALNRDTDHHQILEATLGMIFFQCSVGRPDDSLPDIPWHQHFQAATSLVHKLELPRHLVDLNAHADAQPPFNMTLTAWIDILGATMVGRVPSFADTYREKNMANSSMGLAELMGCEDRVMYLISEIACLEAMAIEGMDSMQLCGHIRYLGDQITAMDPGPNALGNVYSSTGAVRPKQLSKNMTAVFRCAARIYLCILVPEFDRYSPNITCLVDALVQAMEYIPAGPDGFDRSLVWPLLIAGSISLPGSSFRNMFNERCQRMGEAAEFGSLGRVKELLKDVWHTNDAAFTRGERQSVHWRDVMLQKGWDFLLI
jgi:C6 transcription factor Pro1